MFGYKIILIIVWSNNIFLVPCSIIREYKNNKYTYPLQTNKYKFYKYRLKPTIIKEI